MNIYREAINHVEDAIEFAEENEDINSEEFLDFLDTINKLSVKY